MEVRNIPGSGRGVVATRDLRQGEVILRENAYVFVPLVTQRLSTSTCVNCLKQFPSAEPHPRCESCGEHLCSDACSAIISGETSHHKRHGECRAFELCKPLCVEVSHDDFNHLRAIVAVAIRAKLEGVEDALDEPTRRFKPKVQPEIEVVCTKFAEKPEEMKFGYDPESSQAMATVNTSDDTAPASQVLPPPSCDPGSSEEWDAYMASLPPAPPVTFASVARLTANVSRFEEDQLELYRQLHAHYEALQEEYDEELPVVSETMFLKLSCAYQCNGFSLWNASNKEVASGMFGTAAMVNHNCTPNIKKYFHGRELLFRTIRPVAAGEQLCLSYVDTKLALNLRQWRLSTQYFFECRCQRCINELKR